MFNIGGEAKQGVTVGTYGPSEGGDGGTDGQNPLVGYIQPAKGNGWIAWFTKKGDMILYPNREEDGAVIGEPIRVSHKGGTQ